MDSSGAPAVAPARARRSERGQALVEFALIVPLFLFIVVGIVQFGIGLNYWLDLQRLANQGARYAVVDHGWTDCDKSKQGTGTCLASLTLQDYLKAVRTSGGNDVRSKVEFEQTTPAVGQSVTVQVASCYRFVALLDLLAINLRGRATMRIEQAPTNYNTVDNDIYADNPCSDPSL